MQCLILMPTIKTHCAGTSSLPVIARGLLSILKDAADDVPSPCLLEQLQASTTEYDLIPACNCPASVNMRAIHIAEAGVNRGTGDFTLTRQATKSSVCRIDRLHVSNVACEAASTGHSPGPLHLCGDWCGF